MRKSLPIILAILLSAGAVACKDPSKSVPAAEVGETAPAEAAAVEEAPAEEAEATTVTETIALTAENTKVEFVGSKVTGKHDGGFNEIEGSLVLAQPLDKTTANVTVQAASVWSDAEQLTEHLRSGDFFEVETYPTATFNLTSIAAEANEDGTRQVNANLTMRGVERPISFPASFDVSDDKVEISAEFSINRKDWGIVYAGQADDLIRDGVILKLSIDAERAGE